MSDDEYNSDEYDAYEESDESAEYDSDESADYYADEPVEYDYQPDSKVALKLFDDDDDESDDDVPPRRFSPNHCKDLEDDAAWKRDLNEALAFAEEARARNTPHDVKAVAPDSAPQVTFKKSALQVALDKSAADLQVKLAQMEADFRARKAQLAAELQLAKAQLAKLDSDWAKFDADLLARKALGKPQEAFPPCVAPVAVATPVTQDAVQLQPFVNQASVEHSLVTLKTYVQPDSVEAFVVQLQTPDHYVVRWLGLWCSKEQQAPFALKDVKPDRAVQFFNNETTPDSFVKEDVLVKKDIVKVTMVMDAVNLDLTQDPFVPKDVVNLITTGGRNVRRCGARVRSGYFASIRVP
jgi:hypothetical protein